MKLSELLLVINKCDMNPISDVIISTNKGWLSITSPKKRADIFIETNADGSHSTRYIRIYDNPKDLTSFCQTKFDKFLQKSGITNVSIKNKISFDEFTKFCTTTGVVDIDKNVEKISIIFTMPSEIAEIDNSIRAYSKQTYDGIRQCIEHKLAMSLYTHMIDIFSGMLNVTESETE